MMIVYVDVKDIQSGRVRHAKIKYVALDVPMGQVPRISYEKETYTITIGIGKRTDLGTFTRDIANDVVKGIGCREAKSTKKHNLRLKDGKIEKIEFVGEGHVTNLTLANIRYEVSEKRGKVVNDLNQGQLLRCGQLARALPGREWQVADQGGEGVGELSDFTTGLGVFNGPRSSHLRHGPCRPDDWRSSFLACSSKGTGALSLFDVGGRCAEYVPRAIRVV